MATHTATTVEEQWQAYRHATLRAPVLTWVQVVLAWTFPAMSTVQVVYNRGVWRAVMAVLLVGAVLAAGARTSVVIQARKEQPPRAFRFAWHVRRLVVRRR